MEPAGWRATPGRFASVKESGDEERNSLVAPPVNGAVHGHSQNRGSIAPPYLSTVIDGKK
jgi:hypothetical protein